MSGKCPCAEPRRRSEPQTEIQPDVPPEAAEPLAPVTPGLEESLQTRYKAYLSGQLPPPRIGAETLPPTREAGLERRVSLDSRECAPASLGVILMEESGNKYEGQIGSNGLEGRGVLFFDGGGSYAGQVSINQAESVIDFVRWNCMPISLRYLLQWQNSAYEGAGIETFANGSHYVGEFCQGKQHGRGVCYYADGTTYGGEWTAGVQEGLGSQASFVSAYFTHCSHVRKTSCESDLRNAGHGRPGRLLLRWQLPRRCAARPRRGGLRNRRGVQRRA